MYVFKISRDPNGKDLPFWPEFTNTRKEYMTLQRNLKVDANYQQNKMDFWEKTIKNLDIGRKYF